MQFEWLAACWPITRDLKFCQIRWWIINNNISFHFRLFPGELTWQKFSKNPKKDLFWTHFGLLLPKFEQKLIFLGKRTLSAFKYSNYLPLCQKSIKPNEPFLRKLLDWCTKNLFILLISSWDTASFRVLQLIKKSHNLIDREHFGPYLMNQNIPKYEIWSSIQQLQ